MILLKKVYWYYLIVQRYYFWYNFDKYFRDFINFPQSAE